MNHTVTVNHSDTVNHGHVADHGHTWNDRKDNRQTSLASAAEMNVGDGQQDPIRIQETISENAMTEEIYEILHSGQSVRFSERTFVTPEQPTVYLTFDDGPSDLTPQILDILHEESVPATFFVLGQSAKRHADIVQRMVQEGHAIGNHTYDHNYSTLYQNFADFFSQVERTDEILVELTGIKTALFRAPGGTYMNFDAFYFYYMEQAGYFVYDWDVDGGDAKRRGVPASEIIANIQQSPLKHELNVLLHDSAGHAETVKALPDIIQYYKEQGYTFAALDRTVKPKIFTQTKSKWGRHISKQSHMTHIHTVRQFNDRRDQHLPNPLQSDYRPDKHTQPTKDRNLPDGKQLVLSYGSYRQVLDEQEYEIIDGHFHVPLDRLAEGLGGGVYVHEHTRDITASWNGFSLSYVPSENKLTKIGRASCRERV